MCVCVCEGDTARVNVLPWDCVRADSRYDLCSKSKTSRLTSSNGCHLALYPRSVQRKVFTGTSSCLCVKEERFSCQSVSLCSFLNPLLMIMLSIHNVFCFFFLFCPSFFNSLRVFFFGPGRGSNEAGWRPDFYMQHCFFILFYYLVWCWVGFKNSP